MPSSISVSCGSPYLVNSLPTTAHTNVKSCLPMLCYPLSVTNCNSTNKTFSKVDLDSSFASFSSIQLGDINNKMGHFPLNNPFSSTVYNTKSSDHAYSPLFDTLDPFPAIMSLPESHPKSQVDSHALMLQCNPSLGNLSPYQEECHVRPYPSLHVQSDNTDMVIPKQVTSDVVDKVDDIPGSIATSCESVRSESSCSSLSADSHNEQVAPRNHWYPCEAPFDASFSDPCYQLHREESLLYRSMTDQSRPFHNTSCVTTRHVSYFHHSRDQMPASKPGDSSSKYDSHGKSKTQESVYHTSVPLGWTRLICEGAVVYVSPSNAYLHSVQDVCAYLSSNGTCKCGLPCPFQVDKLFNFNPESTSGLLSTAARSCRHVANDGIENVAAIKRRKEVVGHNGMAATVETTSRSDVVPSSTFGPKDMQRVPESLGTVEPSHKIQSGPSFLDNPSEYLAQQTALLQHHITLLSPSKDTSSALVPAVQVLSQPVVQIVNPVVMPQTLSLQIVPGTPLSESGTASRSCSAMRSKRPKKRKAPSQSVASLLQAGTHTSSPMMFAPTATTLLQPVNFIQNVPILLPSMSVMGTALLSPVAALPASNTGLLLQIATPGQLLLSSHAGSMQASRETPGSIFY